MNAFEEAIRHRKAAINFVRKQFKFSIEQAEDTVNDALVSANRTPAQPDPRFVKSWFFRICYNHALNHIRSIQGHKKDRKFVRIEELYGEPSPQRSQEQVAHAKGVQKKIEKILSQMGDRQAEAFRLRVFREMTFTEIAEIMDCPYDTAKANFRHGLLKIREKLIELNIDIM